MKSLVKLLWVLALICLLFSNVASAQAQKKANPNVPTYQLFGSAQLLTHFIDKGLSMSNNKPAMNASFLANLGSQFSFGFWGSNISYVQQPDDNFWFRMQGEVKIDFIKKGGLKVYLTDNHFYTSKQRNGQTLGVDVEYDKFVGKIEWMSNLEGTKTNGEYYRFGRIFNYKKGFKIALQGGYTNSRSPYIISFFDFNVEGRYFMNNYANFNGGISMTSNLSQLSGRGQPAIYFGMALVY